MLEKSLVNLGMEEKEAKIYLALLELQESTITDISRKSGVKRTTVYHIIEALLARGFVARVARKKEQLYFAQDPQRIITELEERQKKARALMPELLSVMNTLDTKPKIKYFEGIIGVKEVFEDTLRHPESEILSWWPYPYLNLGEEYFWENYNPRRVENRIWIRSLVPDTEENREMSLKLKEKWITRTKFVRDDAFSSFDIEIKIYGKKKVGIISYQEDLGIIIESKKIFEGVRAIFEALWERLPE